MYFFSNLGKEKQKYKYEIRKDNKTNKNQNFLPFPLLKARVGLKVYIKHRSIWSRFSFHLK